jgi:hypothetical protein
VVLLVKIGLSGIQFNIYQGKKTTCSRNKQTNKQTKWDNAIENRASGYPGVL